VLDRRIQSNPEPELRVSLHDQDDTTALPGLKRVKQCLANGLSPFYSEFDFDSMRNSHTITARPIRHLDLALTSMGITPGSLIPTLEAGMCSESVPWNQECYQKHDRAPDSYASHGSNTIISSKLYAIRYTKGAHKSSRNSSGFIWHMVSCWSPKLSQG